MSQCHLLIYLRYINNFIVHSNVLESQYRFSKSSYIMWLCISRILLSNSKYNVDKHITLINTYIMFLGRSIFRGYIYSFIISYDIRSGYYHCQLCIDHDIMPCIQTLYT